MTFQFQLTVGLIAHFQNHQNSTGLIQASAAMAALTNTLAHVHFSAARPEIHFLVFGLAADHVSSQCFHYHFFQIVKNERCLVQMNSLQLLFVGCLSRVYLLYNVSNTCTFTLVDQNKCKIFKTIY